MFAAAFVEFLVRGACGDEMADGTTDDEREVELQGNEHAKCKSQGRNFQELKHEGDERAAYFFRASILLLSLFFLCPNSPIEWAVPVGSY